MSKVVHQIPSFFGGVSQQPYQQRFDNQCEEQINAFSTVSKGLYKRQGTHFISNLIGTDIGDNAAVHYTKKDDFGEYIIMASSLGVKIFDLSGATYPIYGKLNQDAPDFTYLSGITDATEGLAIVSVADYTIIANKAKEVKMLPRSVSAQTAEVFFDVTGTQHGQTFSIRVGV